MTSLPRLAGRAAAAAALLLGAPAAALASGGGGDASFAKEVTLPWLAPFALLLLAIAVLPLAAAHWWEHNRNKGIVAAACALPVLGFLVSHRAGGGTDALLHAGIEYVAFIALLGSLFVVSGGILITGDIRATPRNNTLLLLVGGVLANFIGTTGASMLLIRPALRINSQRKFTTHTVVFFIFIVSNVGGCLTPLGDPPLFLGFLQGVPFAWTLSLWKEWVFMLAALLAVYFVLDTMRYRKEAPADVARDDSQVEPLAVHGKVNFALLAGVIAAILVPAHFGWPAWVQAVLMGALAFASLKVTPPGLREKNGFSFGPIVEVAVLFAGIFVAMIPALKYLEVHGQELGVRSPAQFFWATGALSSFLDNAPTYLTFVSVAAGLPAPAAGMETVRMTPGLIPADLLTAISLGAVFMGANTYIGNGPNFMVKSIAESAGRRMPSFFGYMGWSVAVLVPLFAVVTLLFF